jgi:hypothetical protein
MAGIRLHEVNDSGKGYEYQENSDFLEKSLDYAYENFCLTHGKFCF